jgi:membrane protein
MRPGTRSAGAGTAANPGADATRPGTARRGAARTLWRELVAGFEEHDLLTYASAIAFQILTAIVPFLLFALAVANLARANGIWRDHLQPQLRANVSPALFSVIHGAVQTVEGHQLLWVTLGGGLALWQISGAVRAVAGALARIYRSQTRRPFFKRYLISLVLSFELGACFLAIAVCVVFAPFLWSTQSGTIADVSGLLVRWTLAAGILFVVIALLVRHAPACPQPLPWVSLGASLVIGSWLVVSVGFYLYLTDIASYQSVFGDLAAVIVAMAYLYVSTTVFLFGAQLDAIIRARTTGHAAGAAQD